jgi:cytoplasmic iron level regulating protein YaaA (DUF328/UPF0246 family)
MLILLSPAKQMDFTGITAEPEEMDTPVFYEESVILNGLLQKYGPEDLVSLMGISRKLADKSFRDIQRFSSGDAPIKPAIFAYSGTVFKALDPETLSAEQILFAHKHLRILSGRYGILSPLTGISPYRLEMKTPLNLPDGRSLTSIWKPLISRYLRNESLILNLASGEYSAVIDRKNLKGQVITIHFREKEGEKLRTVGMYAKTARGLMLRRILKEMITDLRILQEGETAGYRYDGNLSGESDWVFTRENKGDR